MSSSLALAAPLFFAALLLGAGAPYGRHLLLETAAWNPDFKAFLVRQGLSPFLDSSVWLSIFLTTFYGLCSALAFLRRRWVLIILRFSLYLLVIAACVYLYEVCDLWSGLRREKLEVEGVAPDEFYAYYLQTCHLLPGLLVAALSLWGILLSWRRRALNAFRAGPVLEPTAADRWAELAARVWRKPAARGFAVSAAMHASILLIPLIIMLLTRLTFYMVPYGRGLPDAGGGAKAAAQGEGMRKGGKSAKGVPKKKAPGGEKAVEIKLSEKNYIGRISYVFAAGKGGAPALLSEADLQKFEEDTQDQYSTQTMQIIAGGRGSGTGGGVGPGHRPGGVGKGGVGPGGWPQGIKGAVIRFVRLQYRGEDWDDGMSSSEGADRNFLAYFEKEIGFKAATRGEKVSLAELRLVKRNAVPPYLFMTGSRNIEIPPHEFQVLRKYLEENGGTLIADCGSGNWDRSFRRFIAQLYPDKPLVNIPDDDLIYRFPYPFPNGAPPLWHHGGNRALGIRSQGRWTVFYHPGDVNDAWKTGHSGLDPQLAERAYKLGVNLVYYSFCNWDEVQRKTRK